MKEDTAEDFALCVYRRATRISPTTQGFDVHALPFEHCEESLVDVIRERDAEHAAALAASEERVRELGNILLALINESTNPTDDGSSFDACVSAARAALEEAKIEEQKPTCKGWPSTPIPKELQDDCCIPEGESILGDAKYQKE